MNTFVDFISAPFRRLLWNNTASALSEQKRAVDSSARDTLFIINQALYDNSAYETCWDTIRNRCFPNCDPDVRVFGYFSPWKEIVESYVSNVLPGVWGNGMDIAEQIDDEDVNPRLSDPIRRIWRDSNLDSDKAVIQRHAANFGTVGLRAVKMPDDGDDRGPVVVQHDHPSRIFNVEEDTRGNLTAVTLKYKIQQNFGTAADPKYESVDVVELITDEEFSQKFDEVEQLPDEQRRNIFGFCPYVLLRHKDNGTAFGDWAYKGSETQVHAINFRISQQDRSIGRHQFPKWFIAAGGDKPVEVKMGRDSASFSKLNPDSPTPFMQAIVPNIDQDGAQKFWMELRDMLRGRQPELTINDVRLLANISGETIRRVLTPAKQAILDVRPNYDHAMIRVLQMCLSIGSETGLWDVGAGTGDGSGDKAYKTGLESFQFIERPALPSTPLEDMEEIDARDKDKASKFALAKQAQGVGVSNAEVLRVAGYDDEQIKTMQAERATVDVVPRVQQ